MITGMDTERVAALAMRMAVVADRVRALETRLTAGLAHTDWVGTDRTRFETAWQGEHQRALRQAATDLDAASDLASQNVRDQDGASR